MIEFPKDTHKIHKFKLGDRMYVADLDQGQVTQIDEVSCDILEVCSSLSNDKILGRLSKKYKEARILESLEKLEKLGRMGLLFSDGAQIETHSAGAGQRPRIFVTSGFLRQRSRTSFATNLNNYRLLKSLAEYADVHLAFPESSEGDDEEKEDEIDFSVEGVHKVPFEVGRTYSPAKSVVEDCDGILALSPSSFDELAFSRYNTIPVIFRVYSDMNLKDSVINSTLDKFAALRHYDALSPDASWVKNVLSQMVSDLTRFHTIPNGIDTSAFSPMDKELAKRKAAEAFGNDDILEKPFVGVIAPFQLQQGVKIVSKLAAMNVNVMFLILDPLLEHYLHNKPGNVELFSIRDAQDKDATPVIFNALDLLFFPAVIGTPSSMILEAMACGVPPIVVSHGDLPEEIGDAGILIPLKQDFAVPIDLVSERIGLLLENTSERMRLAAEARKQASSFTWDRTAREFVDLFKTLNRKKSLRQRNPENRFPVIFSRYYSKSQGTVGSHALQLPTFSRQSVEKGLAATLLEDHTSAEVEAILMHILKDREKVARIMEEVT